MHFFGQLYLVP